MGAAPGLVRLPRGAASVCGAAPAGLAGCGVANFCLALWHRYRCDHGQPCSHYWSKNTLPKLRSTAGRLGAARSAHKAWAAFSEREQESSTDGVRAGEMSGVEDTKRLVKLRVVEKATSGAKASQISRSTSRNSQHDRISTQGCPSPSLRSQTTTAAARARVTAMDPEIGKKTCDIELPQQQPKKSQRKCV